MTHLTRRNILRTGGAIGVAGGLALAGQGQAWSWAPSGSIVGDGIGADPRWEWDGVADPLMAAVIERGDVPLVNSLLRTWTKNGQALPAGLPADVAAFVESARQLPSWASQSKLASSYAFNTKRGVFV